MLPSKASTAPSRLLLALLLSAALLPAAALGQEAAPPMPEDPRAPRYREVERGLFTGFEAGYLSLFKTPVADRAKFPFAGDGGGNAGGILVGATLGYDLTRRLAVAIYALGGNARASISSDTYGVERLHFYVHGRGGLLITQPEGLLGKNDVYVAGGPGVEYFTHLRHFSVGLAADIAYLTKAKAAGLTVTPTLRYTF